MRLTQLQLENYRSIQSLDLEIEDFQVLFGRNNVGKSNVLEALRDYKQVIPNGGFGNSWYEERVYNKSPGRNIRFNLEFALNKQERKFLKYELKENHGVSEKTISELEYNNWGTSIRHEFKVNENTTFSAKLSSNYDGRWVPVYELTPHDERDFAILESDLDTYPNYEMQVVRSGDVDRLTQVIRDPYRDLFEETVNNWRWVSPFRQPKTAGEIAETYDLDSESANLATVLHTLSNNEPNTYRRIVNGYTAIMEGVTKLITPIQQQGNTTQTTVEVVEDGVRFDLSEISAGSKQILSLLTDIETAKDTAPLLLLEEPETHLHPGAQRTLYTSVRELAEDSLTQVVVTTHSDVFVDQSDSSQLVKAVRNRAGTEFREIAPDDVRSELQDLGYGKSELLQSKAVVFVEGRSDKQIIQEFAQTLGFPLKENGIKVIDLEGEGNMKSDGQSLVKLLTAFEVPFLFLLDSHDNEPREVQDELLSAVNAPQGEWEVTPSEIFVWEGYGIESYLLESPTAIADTIEEKEDTVISMVEENSSIHDPAEILNEIFTGTVNREYQKNADGVLISRKMGEGEIPDEVKNAVDKISILT